MKRIMLCLLLAGCTVDPVETGPDGLYSSYFLSQVDSQLLPVQSLEFPEGQMLTGGYIAFLSSGVTQDEHGARVVSGQVRRSSMVRPIGGGDDQLMQEDLQFTLSKGTLRIDLCPVTAECIVPVELVGPASHDELDLTLVINGTARALYRYFAALPD